ncbi:MAG: Fur family transcriptional regulator [Pseudomonadota bacterium]
MATNEKIDVGTVFAGHDHNVCAETALKRAEKEVGERGLRLTPVRRRALEILLEEHRALGAYEVLERLAAEGFGAQPPVAYRALDFLVEHGLAHRIQRLNAFAACMHAGLDHEPVFFICRDCKMVAETPAAPVRRAIQDAADRIGFQPVHAHVEVLGVCPACAV